MINQFDLSDEMLASYIDGTCSPIENSIVSQYLNDESIREVLDITNEMPSDVDLNEFDSIDITDKIDHFMKPFEEYSELKHDLDNKRNNIL